MSRSRLPAVQQVSRSIRSRNTCSARAVGMREEMAVPSKLATLECSTCTALIDVFQQYEPDLALIWDARDVEGPSCQHPPSTSCPNARAEVERRYPDGGGT